jgi:hypothetical protein
MPKKMATTKKATIQLQNVNRPGQELPVDAVKYKATRKVLLKVVPKRTPGMTAAEIYGRALPLLPQDLFPGGSTAGWWLKGVQLDLEAKSLLIREKTSPLRWRLA